MLLRFSLVVLLAGCSSAEFAIATSGDASGIADTGTNTGTSDTAKIDPKDDAVAADGFVAADGSVADGSVADGSVGPDAAPPLCSKGAPMVSCTPNLYDKHHDIADTVALSPPISLSTKHVVSFLLGKRGRIEKIGLKLRRTEVGAGIDGSFTVSAFYAPCPNPASWVPIGKHVRSGGEVTSDFTFYFNPAQTAGAVPYLPIGEHDTRIAFVIETDSLHYSWTLQGTPTPAENPLGFQWGTKLGPALWKLSEGQIAATMSYLNQCP